MTKSLLIPRRLTIRLRQRPQLACAALFIEVMKADYELDDREKSELVSLLQSSLNIQKEDIQELMRLAQEEADQATSLYEFTRLINDQYSYSQKSPTDSEYVADSFFR